MAHFIIIIFIYQKQAKIVCIYINVIHEEPIYFSNPALSFLCLCINYFSFFFLATLFYMIWSITLIEKRKLTMIKGLSMGLRFFVKYRAYQKQ